MIDSSDFFNEAIKRYRSIIFLEVQSFQKGVHRQDVTATYYMIAASERPLRSDRLVDLSPCRGLSAVDLDR
jgi:hypothetical protein